MDLQWNAWRGRFLRLIRTCVVLLGTLSLSGGCLSSSDAKSVFDPQHEPMETAESTIPRLFAKRIESHQVPEPHERLLREAKLILPGTKGRFRYFTFSVTNPYEDKRLFFWVNHRVLTFSFMKIFALVNDEEWIPVCGYFGPREDSLLGFSCDCDPFKRLYPDQDAEHFFAELSSPTYFMNRSEGGLQQVYVAPKCTVEFQFLFYETHNPWCFLMKGYLGNPKYNYPVDKSEIIITSGMMDGTKSDGSTEILPGEIDWGLAREWPSCNMTNGILRTLD